jgi:hypothetical protein
MVSTHALSAQRASAIPERGVCALAAALPPAIHNLSREHCLDSARYATLRQSEY